MYFNLPKSSERQKILNKKSSSSSMISTESTTTTVMAEDRISEIIHNLDDHWGSPPILTPDTLAHILNHQWINNTAEDDEEIKKKVAKTVTNQKLNTNTTNNKTNKKVISNLIEEFCKTIQVIDTENKFAVTKDLKNDPIIQKFISSKEEDQSENVLKHLVELLQYHNNNK